VLGLRRPKARRIVNDANARAPALLEDYAIPFICNVFGLAVPRRSGMAKLVFGMNQSLDGYVDHTAFAPAPTLFRHFIEEARGGERLRPRDV
jgi:hypothetical protein